MSLSSDLNKLRKKRLEEEEKMTPEERAEALGPVFTGFSTDVNKGITSDEYRAIQKHMVGYDSAMSQYNLSKAREEAEKEKDDSIVKAGAFDDGYQFGDLFLSIGSTIGDVASGIGQGFLGTFEGVADLLLHGGSAVAGAFGAEGLSKDLKDAAEFNVVGNTFAPLDDLVDDNSFLGSKTEGVEQALGQIGSMILTGGAASTSLGATAATTGMTFASSMGQGINEAYTGGATAEEAWSYGALSGVVNAGSELIFGGLGKTVNALGMSRGISSLDDAFAKKISSKISSTFWKNATEFGIKAGAEGTEEVLAGLGTAVAKKLTYMSDEDLGKLIEDENLLEQFVVGTVTSGFAQSGIIPGKTADGKFGLQDGSLIDTIKKGEDFITGFTQNEQKVIDREFEKRVAAAEESGKKLSKSEKNKLYDQVVEDMANGGISIDTIEEVLGGDSYKAYQDAVASDKALIEEYEELGKKKGATLAEQERFRELHGQMKDIKSDTRYDDLKGKLSRSAFESVMGDRNGKGSGLVSSYVEANNRGKAFETDINTVKEEYRDTFQRAIDSGVLNNTRGARTFVELVAKLEADKGVKFDFVNNEKLKGTSFARDDAFVNGYYDRKGNTIGINVDSHKAWQTTVGHEITHVMEGTELYAEMQKALFDYAEAKGELKSRREALAKLYKAEDVDSELAADLVGDYLFTDKDFIVNLSKNRNLFQKIYDEIKYLYKIATAGSKEKRQLEEIKYKFEQAYKADVKTDSKADGDVKHSVSASTDKDYLDAVNRGDTETAQKMVDEAAKASGYNYRGVHRAKTDFTVFDRAKIGTGAGLQFGDGFYISLDIKDKATADYADSAYGKVKMDLYVKMQSPLELGKPISEETVARMQNDMAWFGDDESVKYGVLPDTVRKQLTSGDSYEQMEAIRWLAQKNVMQISELLKEYGFDGIISENEYVTQAVVWDENQLKSSDAITYDDNGNVIPLSQRFNAENNDIRYSLSDSDGKKLTNEQNEYFKNSKMRDENGNLKVMYHGSQDAGFHIFDAKFSDDDTSFFFVDRNDVAASYSGTSETYEAQTIRTAEDMNNFLAKIGYDHYEAVEKDGKFELLEDNEHVAWSDTAQGIYEEFCWYEGVGEGDANYKVYLNLKNPLVVDAEGRNWNNISREFSQEIADRYNSLTAEEKDALRGLAEWGDYGVFKDEMLEARALAERGEAGVFDEAYTKNLASAYRKLGGANANLYDAFSIASDNFSADSINEFAVKQMNTRDYAQKAKAEGYDGVIFNNIVDVGGYGNGSEGASTVAIAFSSEQVKSVANEKPTGDPDIRFSLSKPVEETKDLMALHNLKGNELLKSLELGGLPMPSLAVIKAESGHEQYGDISLIFPKETIDPKANKANKVYGGDAWTPTYPRMEYKANEDVAKRIRDKYYALEREYDYDTVRPLYDYVYELENVLNRNGGEAGLKEELYGNTKLMQVYLLDSGKGAISPVQKEIRTELTDHEVSMNEFLTQKLGKDVIDGVSQAGLGSPIEQRKAYWANHGEAIKAAYGEFLTNEFGFSKEDVQNVLANTTTAALLKVVRDAKRYQTNGRVTIKYEEDYQATQKAIREAAGEGYKAWIDDLFSGSEEKSGIRNNLDNYTPSGNRRSWDALHWENTLENVVKAMKQQDSTGSEAVFGVHKFFAASSKEYGSIAEIKADADRLHKIDDGDYQAAKDAFEARFSDIARKIMDKSESNPFIAMDNAMECIVDAVRNSHTQAGIYKELSQYSHLNVTKQDVADIVSLVSDIGNMPTGYFEAKPQRAVSFDEVGVFVIPRNADVKLKQELLNRGYAIAEYDPDVEGDRTKVVNSFEQFKFSLSDVNETPKRYGDFYTPASDLRFNAPMSEDIAPVANVQETAKDAGYSSKTDNVAPIIEDVTRNWRDIIKSMPMADRSLSDDSEWTDAEIQANNQIRNTVANAAINEVIRDVESGMSAKELMAKSKAALKEYESIQAAKPYGESYTEAESIMLYTLHNQYSLYDSAARNPSSVNELKYYPVHDAPTNEDEANALAKDSLARITDADAPPEAEAPYYGESADAMPSDPFEDRDIKAVGNRKVKAYMYENPEVKPFFQEEANVMLGELRDTTKGERFYTQTPDGRTDEYGSIVYGAESYGFYSGTQRHTTDDIAYLLDECGYSYAEIEKGLKAIIEDDGKENNACSKRIEFLLNDRLLHGYRDLDGYGIPENQDYINLLNEKQITEYNDEARKSFFDVADEYAPPADFAPVAEESPVTDDIAPIAESAPKIEKSAPAEAEPPKVAKVMTEEPNVSKEKRSILNKFRANALDKGSVVEDLSLKTGNRELDAKYNFMRYSESKAQTYIKNHLKPLVDKVEKSGKAQQFYEYAYHLHNIDRMSIESNAQARLAELKGKFGLLKLDQIKAIAAKKITEQTTERTAQTIREAKEYLNALEAKNKPVYGDTVTADVSREAVKRLEAENPEFKGLSEAVIEYNAALRKMLVDGNVISQQTADLWAKQYPHYVPIRRLGKDGLGVTVPLDTRKTGVNAPIKKATGGNSDILPLFDTMAMRTEQTFKAIARNSFGVELMHTLDSVVESEATNLDEVMDGFDNHEDLLQEGKNGQKPTFTVFEGGKRVTFEISEDMYDALKPTSEGLKYTNKVANVANNFFRGLLTEYNPVFLTTNAIKDAQDVLINSQHPGKTYANIPKAIGELATKGKWYTEYMENGGEQNTYFDSESKTFKEEKRGLARWIGKIADANNFIERAPRLAEYIASRESGASIEVAMLDAARVTTNFAAGGDVTKFLNRNGATFLNASVQGFNQQIRNVREAKANGFKGWMKLAAKVAIAGLPAVLLNNLLWDDDEEYEELSDYVKDNYYVVAKYGDGQFIRIPKGRTLAVIQNAFEQIGNAITGDDEVDLENFLNLAISNLAPNNPIDNNLISPIIQVANNKTWYGEDLVPTRLQDLPDAEQYDESTDALSKWLGETFGWSPYKVNYLLNQYSGGLGDVFLPMMTPESDGGGILAPFVDKFTTDSTMNNQNISDFYDKVDELAKDANSAHATDEDVLAYKYMNSISAEIGELYAQKREIQNSDLSDSEKDAAIREIQAQIVALTKEGLATYGEAYITDGYAVVGDRYYRQNDDGEWAKLTDKQVEKMDDVVDELGIDPSAYWGNKSEYDFAYEYPEKYAVAKSVGGYSAYKTYSSELYDIKADKDKYGKSISGSRKEKVIDYINNLDADYGTKIILFKSEYNADDTYNYDIIEYLNSRNDISYKDMETILKELGFTVDSNGNITWD